MADGNVRQIQDGGVFVAWVLQDAVVQDVDRLAIAFKLTLEWRLALSRSSQLSLGTSYSVAKYALSTSSNQDTQTSALTAGWLTALGDGSAVFSLTGSFGMEHGVGGRDDGDRRFYGPRLTLQKNFAEKMGGYASLGATFSKYTGTNSLYLLSRDESLYDIALGVIWTVGKGQGADGTPAVQRPAQRKQCRSVFV